MMPATRRRKPPRLVEEWPLTALLAVAVLYATYLVALWGR